MVERLKIAIEKARAQREDGKPAAVSGASAGVASGPVAGSAAGAPAGASAGSAGKEADGVAGLWQALEEVQISNRVLSRNRVFTRDKSEPAYILFDKLRTRLLKALRANGWTRVGITSPSKGCGKTTVSANLAFSLARQPDIRTMLIDMDLRLPNLSRSLGIERHISIESFLTGEMPPERFFLRAGHNLALGLNAERVQDSAERVQSERTGAVLGGVLEAYQPDVVLFDLPPMLVSDDVMGFMPHLDAMLLVAASGESKASEVDECERLMADNTHFLGVILNKAEEPMQESYEYSSDA